MEEDYVDGLRIMYYGNISNDLFGRLENYAYLCNYCKLDGVKNNN